MGPFDSPYNEGIVVMIDALGFKGIWNRVDPIRLLETLAEIIPKAVEFGLQRSPGLALFYEENGINPDVRILSDTIFIGLHIRKESMSGPPPGDLALLAFRTVRAIAAEITRRIAKSNFPLAYRGCISYGDYACIDNFIVGPAVDEAAELHQNSEAAAIFMAPSALKYFEGRQHPSKIDLGWYYPTYATPMKGGVSIMTRILNPFNRSDFEEVRNRLLATFASAASKDAGVALKERNTRSIFEYLVRQDQLMDQLS